MEGWMSAPKFHAAALVDSIKVRLVVTLGRSGGASEDSRRAGMRIARRAGMRIAEGPE